MILRLLADADLKSAIVTGVVRRNPNIDFKRSVDVPLQGLADTVVLAVAAEDGRVLVSHDVSTMPNHLRAMLSAAASPGVILIPQRLPVAEAIGGCGTERCRKPHLPAPSMVIYGF